MSLETLPDLDVELVDGHDPLLLADLLQRLVLDTRLSLGGEGEMMEYPDLFPLCTYPRLDRLDLVLQALGGEVLVNT